MCHLTLGYDSLLAWQLLAEELDPRQVATNTSTSATFPRGGNTLEAIVSRSLFQVAGLLAHRLEGHERVTHLMLLRLGKIIEGDTSLFQSSR